MLLRFQKICCIALSFAYLIPSLFASDMPTPCVLSADFGTESCRVGLFNAISGELIETCVTGYETVFPKNGFAEQNPLHWWTSFTTACHKILENRGVDNIVGMCIDTTACSVISLDDNFE